MHDIARLSRCRSPGLTGPILHRLPYNQHPPAECGQLQTSFLISAFGSVDVLGKIDIVLASLDTCCSQKWCTFKLLMFAFCQMPERRSSIGPDSGGCEFLVHEIGAAVVTGHPLAFPPKHIGPDRHSRKAPSSPLDHFD